MNQNARGKPTIVTTVGPLGYLAGSVAILLAIFLPVVLAIALSGLGLGWLAWLFGI